MPSPARGAGGWAEYGGGGGRGPPKHPMELAEWKARLTRWRAGPIARVHCSLRPCSPGLLEAWGGAGGGRGLSQGLGEEGRAVGMFG